MSQKTHYNVLGISETATETEIKKAFRSLSLIYHPDRNSSEEAISKMQDITGAYEVLKEPASRKEYDMQLKFGGQVNMDMPNMDDLNDLFGMMFNGMPGMAQQMQGMGGPNIRVFHQNGFGPQQFQMRSSFNQVRNPEIIKKQIIITLEQAYTGCIVELNINRIIENEDNVSREEENIYVNIPSGVLHNETISISGKGNELNKRKGDININVSIENNSTFIRQELDIIMKQKISLKEALCGFTFDFTYLNGKKMSLTNTGNLTIIKPGYQKVIPNMGITRENNTGRFIVHFDIEFPSELSEEVREQLNAILV